MMDRQGQAGWLRPAAEPVCALMTTQAMTVMMAKKSDDRSRGQGSFRGEVTSWTQDSLNGKSFRFGGIEMVASFGQRENGGFMASFRGEW